MDKGKLILGVLAGAAAGALLGVLFAPDKGTETRKKIAEKGSDSADELKEKFNELLNSLTEKLDAVKENTADLYEQGKNKAEGFKKDVKNAMN